MKINLHIDEYETNERIDIHIREMTPTIERLIQHIKHTTKENVLYGKKADEIYPLHLQQIVRIYMENKKLIVETVHDKFLVDKRLYELEEQLPNDFLRISKSEIIHLPHLKKLKLTMNGFIKITFTTGVTTYSSRRYVKKIKGALQL